MDGLRQMRTIAFLKTITSQSNNFIKLSLNINSDYVEEDNAYIYNGIYEFYKYYYMPAPPHAIIICGWYNVLILILPVLVSVNSLPF